MEGFLHLCHCVCLFSASLLHSLPVSWLTFRAFSSDCTVGQFWGSWEMQYRHEAECIRKLQNLISHRALCECLRWNASKNLLRLGACVSEGVCVVLQVFFSFYFLWIRIYWIVPDQCLHKEVIWRWGLITLLRSSCKYEDRSSCIIKRVINKRLLSSNT